MIKGCFWLLLSVALIPPCAIIPEIKLDTIGSKSLILRLHFVIQRSSENIDPYIILDSIFLEK